MPSRIVRTRRIGCRSLLVGSALLLIGCTGSPQRAMVGSSSMPASPSTGAEGSQHDLGKQYLAIATPANAKLDTAFDALSDRDDGDLQAAQADLRSVASIERDFDRQLLEISLPDQIATTARALVQVNEARAELSMRAATSTSLQVLHGYKPKLSTADTQVEQQVRTIRTQLGLPPPDTS